MTKQEAMTVEKLVHRICCQPITEARNGGYAEGAGKTKDDGLADLIEKTETEAKAAIKDLLVEARAEGFKEGWNKYNEAPYNAKLTKLREDGDG